MDDGDEKKKYCSDCIPRHHFRFRGCQCRSRSCRSACTHAELNKDSKLPFLKTNSAHRLLVFFASPSHLAKVKNELEQREAEHPIKPAEAPATAKPKAKGKTKPKALGAALKARGRKVKAAKAVKKKMAGPQRSKAKHRKPKVSMAGRPRGAAAQRARRAKTKGAKARK
ncbi:MAG: hypothetical protein ABSD58_17565 [Verrucomicrobiia bacterium]|jgi:hypothetical protein